MAINFGNDKIKDIYVGSDKIKEVYYGSEKVWGGEDGGEVGYWVHKDTGVKTYFDLTDSSITNGIMSAPSWKLDCSEVQIPLGVTELGQQCFSWNEALTSVALPEGVTILGNNCFVGCSSLTLINIPEGVISLGNGCFSECPFTSITLPESLTSLGFGCFSWCSSLTSITIPEGVTSIGQQCFRYCDTLTLATVLPATPPSLGLYAFINVDYEFNIKVQSPYVDDYKTATNWSAYAAKISAI